MRHLFWLLLLAGLVQPARAQRGFFPETRLGKILFEQEDEHSYRLRTTLSGDSLNARENTRLVAALLDVSLGLFGAHRLYLGTDAKVPVFYTVTIGGGAVLWLIDLGLILLTKDLTPYLNNPHIFMWVRDSDPTQAPPANSLP